VSTIAIVGASLAGAAAADAARRSGFEGEILLIGDEGVAPYERPPLSKGLLRGETEPGDTAVFENDHYSELGVELRLNTRVVGMDPVAGRLDLDTGESLVADRVLLATGAEPRTLDLPGAGLDGVRTLRSRTDSEELRAAIRAAGSIVVIGGGWIGCEVAASARQMGAAVTLVEREREPLRGVLDATVGRAVRALHEERGVTVLTEATVRSIDGAGRVEGVTLDDGTAISTGLALFAVGVDPRTELAALGGLDVDDGVLVDATLTTSAERVLAAGDVARAWHPFYNRRIRVEHWANALHQGAMAGRIMCGEEATYDRLPYFFSDQYDLSLEHVGDASGTEGPPVIRGDILRREFIAFWRADDAVVAATAVNVSDAIEDLGRLILSRTALSESRLADDRLPLAELAPSA